MANAERNKITTCLWFDDQAEEAANFYVSVFENSEILGSIPYLVDTPSDKAIGSVMTVDFELENQQFTALNGGPYFQFTPAISFIVNCETEVEVDELWEKLSDGGETLIPLDSYPFSERYGWTKDKYGLSWQIMVADGKQGQPPKIVPSMMFTNENSGKAKEAIDYYLSVFRDSKNGMFFPHDSEHQNDNEDLAAYADFGLEDQWFATMDSPEDQEFDFNEAVSIVVNCENQEEIDYYWEKLSAVPESEQCGWLKDQYGVSWQIVPEGMNRLYRNEDTEKAKRTMEAMLQMKKLNIEALKNA